MTYNKKSIEDIEIKAGQKVFVRCDFNVPMKDGVITSDKRIVGALPTIKYLMDKGAKVILSSHMGKPHAIFTPNFKLDKKERQFCCFCFYHKETEKFQLNFHLI